jgi:glycosyltransferase involved in cell wall biosynthesis
MISIITINYNRRDDLEKTLKSVFGQSYKHFEYIVIDGGSNDGSLAVIQENDANITNWISEPDKGIFDAMNKGISLSTREYLLFLNGGDTFLNNDSLSLAVSYLNGLKEDIIYGNILVEMSFGGKVVFNYPEKLSFKYFLQRDLPHQATFIKRKLFEEYGVYDISHKINADWSFFILTICKYNASYKHIPCVFTVYNDSGITSTKTKMERIDDQKIFLETHFGMFFQDIYNLVKMEHHSFKSVAYKSMASVGKKLLKIYFSLGGKHYNWIENLKPRYR